MIQHNVDIEEFKKELTILINKYSLENLSNTPDFLLANYLCNCLANFNGITLDRGAWFKSDNVFPFQTKEIEG